MAEASASASRLEERTCVSGVRVRVRVGVGGRVSFRLEARGAHLVGVKVGVRVRVRVRIGGRVSFRLEARGAHLCEGCEG